MDLEKEFIPEDITEQLYDLGLTDGVFNPLGGYYGGVICKLITTHCIPAPTFSQAFRWFREEYDLWHQIYRDGYAEHNIVFQIWRNKGMKSFKYESKVTSYKEAELACLRKLIELIKKENYESD